MVCSPPMLLQGDTVHRLVRQPQQVADASLGQNILTQVLYCEFLNRMAFSLEIWPMPLPFFSREWQT